jgi:lipopolysaccharide export LptBFGC system permease protein LptF
VFADGAWTFFRANIFAQASAASKLIPVMTTNQIAMRDFSETPAQMLGSLKFGEKQAWASTRSADLPLAEISELFRNNPDMSADNKHRLKTKFYGRLAEPWKCFVVVLMAIPFGAQSGRRNLFYGVAGSIFICFAYFVLQSVSLAFGVGGHLPAWLAAWLPNLIFGAAGIFLTWRVR